MEQFGINYYWGKGKKLSRSVFYCMFRKIFRVLCVRYVLTFSFTFSLCRWCANLSINIWKTCHELFLTLSPFSTNTLHASVTAWKLCLFFSLLHLRRIMGKSFWGRCKKKWPQTVFAMKKLRKSVYKQWPWLNMHLMFTSRRIKSKSKPNTGVVFCLKYWS